jgi:hypothetical protein
MEELDIIENNEETGKQFLKSFLTELISNFIEKNISSKKLMALSKALYLLENFKKINYDGTLRIEAGYKISNGGANYFVISICDDEVILSQEGYEYSEDVGSDSVYNELFYMGEIESYFDAKQKLEYWLQGFNELSSDGTDFKTSDETENLDDLLEE